MSPTAVMFDVDTGRISICHCKILKSITLNVLARSDDNALNQCLLVLVSEEDGADCHLFNINISQSEKLIDDVFNLREN
ncbi:hypothetical protein Tco_0091978 [Tanacetum coccineum]